MIDIVGGGAHACARCQCLVLDASREDARHRRFLLQHLDPSLVSERVIVSTLAIGNHIIARKTKPQVKRFANPEIARSATRKCDRRQVALTFVKASAALHALT